MTLTLGIESSCDETAMAVVEDGRVLASVMASQAGAHALFGGVVPELACREHLRVLGPLLDDVCARAGLRPSDLDLVAVARGPGLLGSLLVGVSLAKGLCLATGAALVGVNHLHAHLLATLLQGDIPWPALGLVISGGHTQTMRMDSPARMATLGRTLDDAVGECFDKAAKALNLPYPGGALIDALARRAEPDRGMFPRPYLNNPNLDFSFSGLKTAVANHVAARPHLRLPVMPHGSEPLSGAARLEAIVEALEPLVLEELCVVCASLNWAVADSLRVKVERALAAMGEADCLVVAGGVAANSMIRETMAALAGAHGLPLRLPPRELCTDNADMVALAGQLLFEAGLVHSADMEAVPRGRAVPFDYLEREQGERP